MYRAGLESMLGLRRRGDTFSIDPCIPSSWPGYEIAWRGAHPVSDFRVEPGAPVSRRLEASLDDVAIDAAAIPLVDDGLTHRVRVVLGSVSMPSVS